MTTHRLLGIAASLDTNGTLFLNCRDRAQLTEAIANLGTIFDTAAQLGAAAVAIREGSRVVLQPTTLEVWRELINSQCDASR